MIAELQKDPGTIVSVSTTYYDLESGMETMAVMPKSDFELTVVAHDEIYLIAKVYKADSSGSANVVATYSHVIVKPSGVDLYLFRNLMNHID